MATASHALAQCLAFASTAAEGMLRRCLDQSVALLDAAQAQVPTQVERNELGDAAREILSRGGLWCAQYPGEMRKAFTQAVHHKPARNPGATSPRAELTLVDDAEIVEAIESSRLLQHVLPAVERPVSELDALVSSALGHETVRPELNPMRPEVFAQALRATIGRSPATTVWMKYLAEPLGHELKALYAQLVDQLLQANVQAAGYRVTQAANASRPSAAATAQTAETAGEAAQGLHQHSGGTYGGELSGRQISQALLRDFLVHGMGPEAAQALPPTYYADVERELADLQSAPDSERGGLPAPMPEGYRDLPAVDRPARSVGVQSALDAQMWGPYARSRERSLVRSRLRKDATRVGQVLGLELVRKVVEQVAQDPRLLGPVREAIVALEPSLLRLAMVDPRFFIEEAHPGRQLMERVAQRSFKYNDEFSPEFGVFFQDIGRRFNQLNGLEELADSRPFEEALDQLEKAWGEEDRQLEERQQPAVDAVQFAERRQAEADQIAWDLSSRPDLDNVPNVVQDFLFGPWALVLAQARLTNGTKAIDPHGYAGVISDLLWSVKREVTLKQPAQLFQRVPPMVATLRSGLASIGQDPAETEPFFQALMKLHHPVLKLRRAKTRHDARESGHSPLLPTDRDTTDEAPAPVLAEKVKGQPWMSPRELDAAGFQETLPTDMAELVEAPEMAPAAPEAAVEAVEESPEDTLAHLREGEWVDLYSKREWLRAQLVWASAKATLFMFVSQGGRPHSMTKRICERLIRERLLRPVRTDAVVAQALRVLGSDPAAAQGAHRAGASAARPTPSRFGSLTAVP